MRRAGKLLHLERLLDKKDRSSQKAGAPVAARAASGVQWPDSPAAWTNAASGAGESREILERRVKRTIMRSFGPGDPAFQASRVLLCLPCAWFKVTKLLPRSPTRPD